MASSQINMEKTILLILILTLFSVYAFAINPVEFIDKAFSGQNTLSKSDTEFLILKEFEAGKTTKINQGVHETNLPIQIGGKTYAHGIGTHADSHLKINFTVPAVKFTCKAGIDGQMLGTPASVKGWILADGKEIFRSKVMKGDNTALDINLKLDNIKSLELLLDNAGDGYTCDQWDWADAKVTLADGRKLYLDEIATNSQIKFRYPFSFNYGGVSSDEFLSNWDFKASIKRIDDTTDMKTFTYTDPETKLEVKADVKYYKDSGGIDWTLYFTNKGDKNTKVITNLKSLKTEITTGLTSITQDLTNKTGLMFAAPQENKKNELKDVTVYKTTGSNGCVAFRWDEFKITPEYLQKDKPIELRHTGLSSAGGDLAPYWTLAWSDGGIVTGLGWTGNWCADFSREGKNIKMSAGIQSEKLNTYLKPGETIRSPRIMIAIYSGNNIQAGFNAWRKTMINHITPKKDDKPAFIPIAYSTSGREMTSTTEDIDRAYIESFIGMGYEVSWFDAWYHRNAFPAGMGNYKLPVSEIPDPVRYPHGMTPLTKLIKANKMDVMVWFAPECVMPDTFIAKEHPEYVMFDGSGKSGSFALVNPEAREYMTNILDTAIKEWQISIFRTDSGTDESCLNNYVNEKAPDRVGIAENRSVTALYAFWDELVKRNPGLLIDNCCGGGTRLDLELMSRSISLWRSDSNVWVQYDELKSARLNQLITSNLNNYIPWTTGGSHGPNPYFVRSGYNTGLSFVGDTRPASFDKKEMMKAIAECKRLRKYALGNFYSLFNADSTATSWCAWQYHRPTEGDGYFVAFRREESPYSGLTCFLNDIDESKKYKVKTYRTYKLEKTQTMSGKDLKHFNVNIYDLPGSILVEYSPI